MVSRALHWNGKDLPDELRKLRPGRYLVQDLDAAPELTAEEEADLEAGLDEIDRGEWEPWEQISAELETLLKP